ncbi:hypothetical protein Bhyg_12214, partial [Pseudolycoriella hygida]
MIKMSLIMSLRNVIMITLVIVCTVLFTSHGTNALAIEFETNITVSKDSNLTIRDNAVVLHSLVGDINITIPEEVLEELNNARRRNTQNGDRRFERLTLFGSNNMDDNFRSKAFKNFFECSEEAQWTLSKHSENNRYWVAFFLRNTLDDTSAVRYCCNMMEYISSAETRLSPECEDQISLINYVLTTEEARRTCRQYRFHSAECFLIRWMYYWIPVVTVLLLATIILIVCCMMKSRRSKSYEKAKQRDENK